jgi:hypothetical protein
MHLDKTGKFIELQPRRSHSGRTPAGPYTSIHRTTARNAQIIAFPLLGIGLLLQGTPSAIPSFPAGLVGVFAATALLLSVVAYSCVPHRVSLELRSRAFVD